MKNKYSCFVLLLGIITSSANAGMVRIYPLQDSRTNLCFNPELDLKKTSLRKDDGLVYKKIIPTPCDEIGIYVSKKETKMRYVKNKGICYALLPRENVGPMLPNSKEVMKAYENIRAPVTCTEEVENLISK